MEAKAASSLPGSLIGERSPSVAAGDREAGAGVCWQLRAWRIAEASPARRVRWLTLAMVAAVALSPVLNDLTPLAHSNVLDSVETHTSLAIALLLMVGVLAAFLAGWVQAGPGVRWASLWNPIVPLSAEQGDWIAAQLWAKSLTSLDSRFLVPTFPGGFRVFAERGS